MIEIMRKYPIGTKVRLTSDMMNDEPRTVQGYKQIGDTKYLIFSEGDSVCVQRIVDDEKAVKPIKAFSIPNEAWYKDIVSGDPHIQIGFYYKSGGCIGEFKIVWDNIGIQLRAYDDSWEVLAQMPELIDLMSRIQIEELKPTIKEFAEMLKGIGFENITEYERG